MMKKFIIWILLCFTQIFFAQFPENYTKNLPDIIVPSQETFANSRISYEPSSTGEFTYQYPVDNSSKIPVVLNYTSGVKVDDIGSSTGMSWQLNAGGVISRVVKDRTDENNINWKPSSVNEVTDHAQILVAAETNNNIDTEYDWFNFSISNGINGSFYIDKDLNVFIESKDKIKIEIFDKNAQVTGYGKLLQFKLTDKYGNLYYFGDSTSNIEITTYVDRGAERRAVTGWFLYKVETADKKLVNLIYTLENLSYYAAVNADFNIMPNCPMPYGPGGMTYSEVDISNSRSTSVKPKLSMISENDVEIKFNYNKQRKDLINTNTGNNLLTSIEVKTNGRLNNQYNFEYYDPIVMLAETYFKFPLYESSTRSRHFLKLINDFKKEYNTVFEYINLELLPARFSLNSDYYGYANGAGNISAFPIIEDDNNFGIFKSFTLIPQSIFSANKKINPQLSSIGNLKKIIHPTKGISEIFYEPNSSMELVNESVKTTNHLSAEFNKCYPLYNNPTASFTFVSNGSFIEFDGNAFFNDQGNCGEPDSTRDIHSLIIKENIPGSNNLVSPTNHNISLPFFAEELSNNHIIPTSAGHEYKVQYSVSSRFGNVKGDIFFKYNKRDSMSIKPIYFGGSRVSSVIDSNIEGDSYTRKFYYNKLTEIESLSTSFVYYNEPTVFAQKTKASIFCSPSTGFPSTEIVDSYTATHSSILPIFNNRNNKPFYTYTTEVIENKSAIERNYSYIENQAPYFATQVPILFVPNTNNGEIKSNLLKEENLYKFEEGLFKLYSKKNIEYNNSQLKNNKSYVFKKNFTYNPLIGEEPLINISYGFYENYYGFYNPTLTTSIEYLNGIPLLTTIENFYNNPAHYQLTSQKVTFPDLTTHETKYRYAQEKDNQKLVEANMVGIPLETTTFKNNLALSKVETIYPDQNNFPTTQAGNLLLPLSVKSTLVPTINTLIPPVGEVKETEITYDLYDNKGNLLQYTTKAGVSTSIIWGYDQSQPIAKIEGANYAQVSDHIADIVNYSNTDASVGSNVSEQDLIDKLDAFRKKN
ncbi:hypothetical protein [Chryseobacterium sp. MDT2-18]|uniref:hypothetical protein n=1 Tax=Chryseobacterium sp. MDT2-18 TaxID=1259136 RepID=UPI0027896D11|nr:hypothetical protein [Chryseobacterium sp. MDT2-18]MDQ0477484.1 hypothetical protein [Chryseobacterium sp. MDT2-18]